MKKLYQLVDDLKFLEDIEPETEEQEARAKEMIQTVKLDIETAVTSIAQYILAIDSEASVIKAEEERLYKRRQALKARKEWLKEYLFNEMRASMTGKVKSETVTVYIQNSPPSVEITDVEALPKEFQKIIIEPKKKELLEYFKQFGIIPSGANIITGKEHIVIR